MNIYQLGKEQNITTT